MKKNKMDSRNEELFVVVGAICEFLEFTLKKHNTTIGETFTVMNAAYTNILDQMLQSKSEDESVDDFKSYLKSRVYKLIEIIDCELPIKVEEDEQSK